MIFPAEFISEPRSLWSAAAVGLAAVGVSKAPAVSVAFWSAFCHVPQCSCTVLYLRALKSHFFGLAMMWNCEESCIKWSISATLERVRPLDYVAIRRRPMAAARFVARYSKHSTCAFFPLFFFYFLWKYETTVGVIWRSRPSLHTWPIAHGRWRRAPAIGRTQTEWTFVTFGYFLSRHCPLMDIFH